MGGGKQNMKKKKIIIGTVIIIFIISIGGFLYVYNTQVNEAKVTINEMIKDADKSANIKAYYIAIEKLNDISERMRIGSIGLKTERIEINNNLSEYINKMIKDLDKNANEKNYITIERLSNVSKILSTNFISLEKEKIEINNKLSEYKNKKQIEDDEIEKKAKVEAEVQAEEELKYSPPYVGMTEADLRKCEWGQPDDVNTTTTAYGTSKQYCYSGYKYVYVEDGVVTSIQD
ncbi:MAG: hypothetical protein ACI8WT_004096 [Clostridium sp.]|jgi:hypothetical protein